MDGDLNSGPTAGVILPRTAQRQAISKPCATVRCEWLFPTPRNVAAVQRRRAEVRRANFSASPRATDTPDCSHNSDGPRKTAKHFLLSEESKEQGEELPFDIPEELLAQLEAASLEKTAPINPASLAMDQEHSSELTNQQPGKFRLESEISRGGMGIILKARDMELDRRVAVKLLRKVRKGQFMKPDYRGINARTSP